MARGTVMTSIACAFFAAIVVLQLVSLAHDPSERSWFTLGRASNAGRSNNVVADDDVFSVGVGKADITGPVVELNLMGYANLSQVGKGLRQRIYSRAFIVANPNKADDSFIYVVLDAHSGDTAIRHGILEGLASMGGDYARYGERNVAITGTHSHAGPAAWLNYLLPQITSLGFNKQSYQAVVVGALLSIQRAHDSMAPARLSFGSTDLEDANINRSPYSYLANPEEERAEYDSDVDKTLTLLKIDRVADQKTMGILTWFPVHGTSLYGNNSLIAGDNKGVSAYLFERSVKDDDNFSDGFVAGFSQSNVGDTSPNVLGPICEDTGLECKFEDSTCGGKTQPCHGRGPFFRENDEGAKSCFEIGRRQFTAAKDLFDRMSTDSTKIQGTSDVFAFHHYHNLDGYKFLSPFGDGKTLTTCSASLGFQFAGGTTDGPGAFDFTQNGNGSAEDNPLWYLVRGVLHDPSPEQEECQAPKTILLDVGAVTTPYAWAPNIVDIQTLRVGQLFIIVSASEATSMSGRRWKKAVSQTVADSLGVSNPLVVLGAPGNTYAHYVATEEEYGVQRYEGASTLHGPHTLAAHINLTLTYLPYLSNSASGLPAIPPGPDPPINTNNSLSFITPVIQDNPPIGKSFGDVLEAPDASKAFKPGDTVSTRFVGANPRNDLHQESTFAAIERQTGDDSWEVVRDDSDWTLVYRWERINTILGTSEVTLEWYIDDDYYNVGNPKKLESGTYRMHYYGDSKSIFGGIDSFEGIGDNFKVEV